jgi:hypothetical protein
VRCAKILFKLDAHPITRKLDGWYNYEFSFLQQRILLCLRHFRNTPSMFALRLIPQKGMGENVWDKKKNSNRNGEERANYLPD